MSSTGWFLLRTSLHTNIQNGSPFWSGSMLLDDQKLSSSSVQFSLSVVSDSAIPWTAARQALLSFTICWSLLRFMSIESVILSNCRILCHPLLLSPSIFSSIRVFSNELVLPIRWPNIGASVSASVLPLSIQGCFPLGLTGLISLLSKGLSS